MIQILKQKDRGTAGLTILLSLIVMLFVIGLIVMIFSLMSGSLQSSTFTTTSASVTNETGAYLNSTRGAYTLAQSSLEGFSSPAITQIVNATDGVIIAPGNYSLTGNTIINITSPGWSSVKVSYTYTWRAPNSATNTINDTGKAVAGVVTYFPLFITIGAMVVLILLTVIIIASIRSSGMVDGGMGGSAKNVGTA